MRIAHHWERRVLVVIVFTSVFFYHSTVRFTYGRINPWILRIFYTSAALVSVLSITGQVVVGMQIKFYGFAPILGPAFPIYFAFIYVPTLTAIGILFKERTRSRDATERTRLNYIFLGAFASLLGATTDALPSLGLNIYPLGIISNILFGGLATVAILRYQLMDLRALARNGFAYFIVSSIVFAGYGIILFLFSFLFRNQTTVASVLATIAALLLVTIFFPPVIAGAQRFVDRLFFRERYDHLLALERFTEETRDIGDFSGLAESLIRTVTLAMQARWVAILVPEVDGDDFVVTAATAESDAPQTRINRRSSIARWLQKNQYALDIRELDFDPSLQAMGDAERSDLQSAGTQLFVPMKAQGELTGILALAPKQYGDDYSQADISLLTTFASQAATMTKTPGSTVRRLRVYESLSNWMISTPIFFAPSPTRSNPRSLPSRHPLGSSQCQKRPNSSRKYVRD